MTTKTTTMETAMNFSMGTVEEAQEAAKQAEFMGGNYVKEPGAYQGIVESAMFKKFTSGAGGLEIVIKTSEGQMCKIFILTMKKDGTSTYKNGKGELMPLPGINQIRGALMPCLRQKDLVATQNGDDVIYTSIVGQPLGVLVNIKKTLGKTNGKPDQNKVYDNADLKTFYCPKTGLCGSEILNKVSTPERKEKIIEGLKVIDETAIAVTNNAAGATAGDVADPFAAENAGGASEKDPFAESGAEKSKEKEVEKEKVAEDVPAETASTDAATEEVKETAAEEVSSAPAEDFWN